MTVAIKNVYPGNSHYCDESSSALEKKSQQTIALKTTRLQSVEVGSINSARDVPVYYFTMHRNYNKVNSA